MKDWTGPEAELAAARAYIETLERSLTTQLDRSTQQEERIAELVREVERQRVDAVAESSYKLGAEAAIQRYLRQLAEVRQAYQAAALDNVEAQFVLQAHRARIEALEGQNTRLRVCWYSARKRQQTAFRCFWGQMHASDRRNKYDHGQYEFQQWLWNQFTDRGKAVHALKDKLRDARKRIAELEQDHG